MTPSPDGQPTPLRSDLAGDPDMAELIGMFVHDLPDRVQAISAALTHGNVRDLQRLAHQLRGCGGSYGFPIIGQAAGRVEDALLSQTFPETSLHNARQVIDELLDLCRRASQSRGGNS